MAKISDDILSRIYDRVAQWSLHDLASPGRPTIMQNDVNRGHRNDNRFEDTDLVMSADVEAPYGDTQSPADNPDFDDDKKYDILKGAGPEDNESGRFTEFRKNLERRAPLGTTHVYCPKCTKVLRTFTSPVTELNKWAYERWPDGSLNSMYADGRECECFKSRNASSWALDHSDMKKEAVTYKTAKIGFGKDLNPIITAQIADTEDLQVIGLQDHDGLEKNAGMVFPYKEAKNVKFHMGKVPFPIDIIFVNGKGRIGSIVENILPGTTGHWGHSNVVSVVEVPGGFCKEHGIEVGSEVFELHEPQKKEAAGEPPRYELVNAMDSRGEPISDGPYYLRNIKPVEDIGFMFDYADPEYIELGWFWKPGWQETEPQIHSMGEAGLEDHVLPVPGYETLDSPGSQTESTLRNVKRNLMSKKTSERILEKIAAPQITTMPAYRNLTTGEVRPAPKGHGFTVEEILTPEEYKAWMDAPAGPDIGVPGWEAGWHTSDGRFLTREENEAEFGFYDSDSWRDNLPEDNEHKNIDKVGQEEFPNYPRKDINPKMLPPINLSPEDRFKDRAPVELQVEHQEAPSFSTSTGNDPVSYHDIYDGDSEAPAPVRPS